MKIYDCVGSIFCLMIGTSVAIYAYLLGCGSFRHPGPGFIFFLAALLLIIFSIIDLALTFIRQSKMEKGKEEHSIWSGVRWQKILLVLGCLSVYAIFLESAGFFLITFFLMIFLFKAIEPTKWWISILSSFITVAAAYAIFKLWLEVPFPSGFLGF